MPSLTEKIFESDRCQLRWLTTRLLKSLCTCIRCKLNFIPNYQFMKTLAAKSYLIFIITMYQLKHSRSSSSLKFTWQILRLGILLNLGIPDWWIFVKKNSYQFSSVAPRVRSSQMSSTLKEREIDARLSFCLDLSHSHD